jgi:hypothetical protein
MEAAMRRALVALWLVFAAGCICEPGSARCDGQCVELATQPQHCGACGVSCLPGQLCVDGQCMGSGFTYQGCTRDADCDDGIGCDGRERCVNGGCRNGTPIHCDDGVRCTIETCREPGVCESVPDSTRCGAGQRCNGLPGDGCGL